VVTYQRTMLSGNYRTSTKPKTTNFEFTPFNIQQFILYFVNAQGILLKVILEVVLFTVFLNIIILLLILQDN